MALAVSFGAGCGLVLSGAALPAALALLAALALPIQPFLRPEKRLLVAALCLAVAGGALRAAAWRGREAADCRLRIRAGAAESVTGRFVAPPADGGAPFRIEGGLPGGCRGTARAYLDRGLEGDVRPGVRVRAAAEWRRLPLRAWTTPERAGYLILESVEPAPDGRLRGSVLRLRGRVQDRLARLFGERAPVTEALVLARRERLDPGLRESFARAGIAHLLAISGFHVGIVAGIVLTLARLAGAGPRRSPLVAAGAAWAYVLAIGSPDAAVRAAILLALLAAGRLRSRPVAPPGALATAFLGFLLVDPGGLGRAGFQLSFAGVAGLIVWARPWGAEIRALGRPGGRTVRRPGDGSSRRRRDGGGSGVRRPRWRVPVPGPLADGLAAALAATAATLPLVAWHFGQVPLLGVPATLVLGPVVALAIPGVFACLLLDPVLPGMAGFLAGGVGLLLEAVVRGAVWVAGLPGAAAWVSGTELGTAGGAVAACWILLKHRGAPSARTRRVLLGTSAAAGLLVAPLTGTLGAGALEIAVVDVGQGDAVAIRSPAGRWILVDAGPRSPDFDAGARRVIPYLRRRGAGRLEALVLTHPHLDHVGGAPAVLRGLEVGGVLDPARPVGSASYEEALRAARDRGVGWWAAASRRVLQLDGVELQVLHPLTPGAGGRGGAGASLDADGGRTGPGPGAPAASAPDDPNEHSVVLLLRYGRFVALLTGDAYAPQEDGFLHRIEDPVQLLKVGHHGSSTSTSRALVEGILPEVAVVPVGWRNRYGHPHPEVLQRLSAAGAETYRTDLHGSVVIRGRADGSWSVELPDR